MLVQEMGFSELEVVRCIEKYLSTSTSESEKVDDIPELVDMLEAKTSMTILVKLVDPKDVMDVDSSEDEDKEAQKSGNERQPPTKTINNIDNNKLMTINSYDKLIKYRQFY